MSNKMPEIKSPSCKTQINSTYLFCPNSGTPLVDKNKFDVESDLKSDSQKLIREEEIKQNQISKGNKRLKIIRVAVIVLAVVIIVSAGVGIFFWLDNKNLEVANKAFRNQNNSDNLYTFGETTVTETTTDSEKHGNFVQDKDKVYVTLENGYSSTEKETLICTDKYLVGGLDFDISSTIAEAGNALNGVVIDKHELLGATYLSWTFYKNGTGLYMQYTKDGTTVNI